MKLKYFAAVALAAWLMVTGWLLSMVIAKPAVLRQRGQAGESQLALELRENLGRNERILNLLTGFDDLPVSGDNGQSLVALSPAPGTSPTSAGDDVLDSGYVVSMIVSHGARHRALVNGRYLGAGTRLDDGTRVLAIGPDWVRIEDATNGSRIIRVRGAFAPAPATARETP